MAPVPGTRSTWTVSPRSRTAPVVRHHEDLGGDPLQNLDLPNDDGAALRRRGGSCPVRQSGGPGRRPGSRPTWTHAHEPIMTEARIGRLLAACLHGAIADCCRSGSSSTNTGSRPTACATAPSAWRRSRPSWDSFARRARRTTRSVVAQASWPPSGPLPRCRRRGAAGSAGCRGRGARAPRFAWRRHRSALRSSSRASTRVRRNCRPSRSRQLVVLCGPRAQATPLCGFLRGRRGRDAAAIRIGAVGRTERCRAVGRVHVPRRPGAERRRNRTGSGPRRMRYQPDSLDRSKAGRDRPARHSDPAGGRRRQAAPGSRVLVMPFAADVERRRPAAPARRSGSARPPRAAWRGSRRRWGRHAHPRRAGRRVRSSAVADVRGAHARDDDPGRRADRGLGGRVRRGRARRQAARARAAHSSRSGSERPSVEDAATRRDLRAVRPRVAPGRGRDGAPPPAGHARRRPLPLEAFEIYVKGLVAATPPRAAVSRERHADAPTDPAHPAGALDVYTAQGLHDRALAAANAVPAESPLFRRARFAVALSLIALKRFDGAIRS